MAKTIFWAKKWFTASSTTSSTMATDPFAPAQGPPIRKHRSFLNLTSTASRMTSSLHNWTPDRFHNRLQQLDETGDDNLGRETLSRTIYYNAPRHQRSIGNLTEASLSAPDVRASDTSRRRAIALHQLPSRPSHSPLAEHFHQTRSRASSVSTEYLPENMQHRPINTPHLRPGYSPGGISSRLQRLPTSPFNAPTTQSPLSGSAADPASTISSTSSNWRPPVPSKDGEPSHWEYGRMMQVLDNLTDSVDELSRKITAIMALSGRSTGFQENIATRLISQTRPRAGSEPGSISDLNLTGEVPTTMQQPRMAQPRHVAAAACVLPFGGSAVYRPPTPPRPHSQAIHPFDLNEAGKTPFLPTIPPLPTLTPLPRLGSIPSTTLERLVQESSSKSASEIPTSPLSSHADNADARMHSIDSDYNKLSDSARNMFDNLTYRIHHELQHYQSSAQSVQSCEINYLDVDSTNIGALNSGTDVSPQDEASVSRALSLSMFPPPPPTPSHPPSLYIVPSSRERTLPAPPRPRRPTDAAAADLDEVLPKLRTQIAILEHEWPELFMVDHQPCPELAKRLHFLATLLFTSFGRQNGVQKKSMRATSRQG